MMMTESTKAIQQRLYDNDAEVRRIAVLDLMDIDEDDISPFLIMALRDSDAGVRVEAARLLEGFETLPAVQALIAVLDDTDHEVAEAAAASLSELKDRAMSQPMLEALAGQVNPAKQAALLRALRALRDPNAYAPALAALQSPSSEVRCAGVGVLGYLRNPTALPQIAQIVTNDPDPEVRRIAVGALGYTPDATMVTTTLVTALHDTYWQVREEAAATLGKLKAINAAGDLVRVMSDEYWQVRVKATRSLGKMKARIALPALIAALGHVISNLRKEAAIALGEVGDKSAILALEKALQDPDPDVRKLAQLALNQIIK